MISGLGPDDPGSNPGSLINKHEQKQNAFKIQESKICGKIRSEIRKNCKNESCKSRGKAESQAEMPSLRKSRSQEAFKRNMALYKMRKEIRVERFLLKKIK